MCECKPTPHPHAEIIKAWADGVPIQLKSEGGTWKDIETPAERDFAPMFNKRIEYRIKPQPSDFEQYGVEVGDVWLMDDKLKLFVGGITKKLATVQELESRFHLTYNVNIGPRFETLLFRRGTVNKL